MSRERKSFSDRGKSNKTEGNRRGTDNSRGSKSNNRGAKSFDSRDKYEKGDKKFPAKKFYKKPDETEDKAKSFILKRKLAKITKQAYTFDDKLLVPNKSEILPKDTDLSTNMTKTIKLSMLLIKSDRLLVEGASQNTP